MEAATFERQKDNSDWEYLRERCGGGHADHGRDSIGACVVSASDESILVGRPYLGNDWTSEPPEPWMAEALCAEVGPDMFFPEKGGSTKDAKRVCAACDVRLQCLEYALKRDEHFGIWGGVSERDRRKMRGAA